MFDSFAYALSNLIINNLMLFLVRTVILSFWCSNGSVYFSTYLSLRASTYIHNPLYVNRFMHLTGKTHNFPFYFSVFTLTACEGLVRNSFLILNFPPDVCIMELIFRIMGFSIFFLMYFVYLPYYYLQGLHAFTLVCMLVNFVCMLF